VLGGTGAGKTTLLNTLVTYIMGVKRHDTFRYKIVNEVSKDPTQSVTSEVTKYFIEANKRMPTGMLIIDTPGFGDTNGVE
jgi:septin family protein